MNNSRILGRVAVAALAFCLAVPAAAQEKLTAEDIIARHLESLGTPQAVAAVKTRIADGKGTMKQATQGSATVSGPAIFLLDGDKLAMQIMFNAPSYPEEVFAFDGSKPQVKRVRPEGRSRLGDFFYVYGHLLREGLVGGTLDTAWPLLRLNERQPELKYNGVQEVNGRSVHEVKYAIRRGSGDFDIRLYFDPESFRHVRTVYRLTIRAGMRTSQNLNTGPNLTGSAVADSDNVTRYTLEEDFGDFAAVDGVTLPRNWKIRFTNESPRGTGLGGGANIWEWDIQFNELIHNEPIDPKTFRIS